MKLFLVGIFIVCSTLLHAQDVELPHMEPPFDFPLTFSGNFGELRSNHFHGGLDFKTGGVVDKPVRALADGYISRIRVTNGSGYVLDVCYDNGYTTINRHLNGFLSPIAERIKALQYEKESWEVEIVPEPDEYRVKAGEQIAWSGNTGYSFGPHLHLDVLETATGDYIDPMPFFKERVKDTRPPVIQQFMLFPQLGQGVVNGSSSPVKFLPAQKRNLQAWGVIGAGITAYDYMDGVSNHYGVYDVTLAVDGIEVFRSVVDRFSSAENPMINSWTYNGTCMKSFIEPGNTLRLLQSFNGNRGLITIDEERDYHFSYTLKDVFGNTSKGSFVVTGKQQELPVVDRLGKYFFAWNRTNVLQEPGLDLLVPNGALYDDVYLDTQVSSDSGDVSFTYRLHKIPVHLHKPAQLKIGLLQHPIEDSTKYYVAQLTSNGGKSSVGGKYEDGYMKVEINKLATYKVCIDTIAPEVIPVDKNLWAKKHKVQYRLKDKGTGISHYRATIDGKYALFGRPNIVKSLWECKLDPAFIHKGGKHVVEWEVTDGCGNVTVSREQFIW